MILDVAEEYIDECMDRLRKFYYGNYTIEKDYSRCKIVLFDDVDVETTYYLRDLEDKYA